MLRPGTGITGQQRSLPDDWRTVKMPQLQTLSVEASVSEAVRLERYVMPNSETSSWLYREADCAHVDLLPFFVRQLGLAL